MTNDQIQNTMRSEVINFETFRETEKPYISVGIYGKGFESDVEEQQIKGVLIEYALDEGLPIGRHQLIVMKDKDGYFMPEA